MDRLPDTDRALIDLRYQDNQPVIEMAAESGCGPDAIYKSLQRIRRNLMECIRRSIEGGAD